MKNAECHIVLFRTDKESDRLIIEIIEAHFPSFKVVDQLNDVCELLTDKNPKVFLMTGENMESSLASYYRALETTKEFTLCDHRVVTLIPKHWEGEAYQAFRSGLVDDYLVSRPVYEKHRVILICEHLLIEMGIATNFTDKEVTFTQHAEKYSQEVRQALHSGVERKKHLKATFEKSIMDINRSLDEAAERIQREQPVELDIDLLKQTLNTIKSDEIRPELLHLQEKTIALLSHFLQNAEEDEPDRAEAEQDTADQPDTHTDTEIPTDSVKGKEYKAVRYNQLYNRDVDPDKVLEKHAAMPRLLVVEDDPISLQLTLRLLNAYQIKVDVANTGRLAYASLTSTKYDLVLMDIHLPDTNGIYILDLITSGTGPNSQTPIVMLSGNKNKPTVTNSIERGAKGYIIKPLYKNSVEKLFDKYKLPMKAKI